MKRQAGVTLIELITVVTIVAILASIAVPSYLSYVVRTQRSAAKACLSEYAQLMERFYTSNLTYIGAAPSPGCRTDGGLDQRYTFDVGTPTQKTYTATATPTGVQATKDAKCGALSITQDGTRSVSGTAGVAACW
jgi:type IV pilus assembly protein PilE